MDECEQLPMKPEDERLVEELEDELHRLRLTVEIATSSLNTVSKKMTELKQVIKGHKKRAI